MYMHVGMYMHVCMYVCLRHVCMSASSRDTVGKHGQAVSNSNATATGISGFEGWREQLYKKKKSVAWAWTFVGQQKYD